MKKPLLFVLAIIALNGILNANPVDAKMARTVASNFYKQNSRTMVSGIELAYTETTGGGMPAYYIFNINKQDGFVIISADDHAIPVIGYSFHGHYLAATVSPEFTFWMQHYKSQLSYLVSNKIQSNSDIQGQWDIYRNGKKNAPRKKITSGTSLGPLLSTTWSQNPYYNGFCPGGSVTGCVATAMAQIMKYWNYPPHGIGSNYYYQTPYGFIYANFNHPYDWAAMRNSLNSKDTAVARLMLDAGVSVDMQYADSGSGSWVFTWEDSICAQNSYTKYFGYDSTTLQGLMASSYTDSAWRALLMNELTNKRVVNMSGYSGLHLGGHSWVCDGYDSNTYFHMNWGWEGLDDGFFLLTKMNPAFTAPFDYDIAALIGIQPSLLSAINFSASPTTICTGSAVTFRDNSLSNAPIRSRLWSFPGGIPSSSTLQNPSVTYTTPGTYNATESITNSNGTDSLVAYSIITVKAPVSLPLLQTFESPAFPPTGWNLNNPTNYSVVWALNTTVGGYGKSKQCMYFDNYNSLLDLAEQKQQIYTQAYDFTSAVNQKLWFDIAYAPFNTLYSDTLAVYYSTDCGTTFNLLYLKGGMTLCTAGESVVDGANTNYNGAFSPLPSNWRTDTINLNLLNGSSHVIFSFENRSGWGSPIYIDNINIGNSPNSIEQLSVHNAVILYSNPNNGKLNIVVSSQLSVARDARIEIYNAWGQEVFTSSLPSPKGEGASFSYQINLSAEPSGVYLYRVVGAQNFAPIGEGKFVIER